MRCDETGADDVIVPVGEEFDETVVEIVGLAGDYFIETEDYFFVLTVAF